MSDEFEDGAIGVPVDDSQQPTSVISTQRDKGSYFKSLAVLHLVVWGAFATFVGSTLGIVIRNEVVAKMIELDRLSAVAQTRQEWETLQNSISAYVWTGAMFTGGWPFALLYFGFVILIFTAFWAVVNMTSIRILTLPRPVTAFEGFIVTAPRILYGLLPLYMGWVIIVGTIGLLLAPKISNPAAYTGSWRILDVLGSLPIALIIALLLCVAWILLLPQATLADSPKTAWYSSIRLIFKAPGLVIGRWFIYWFIAIAGIAILIYVALWATAILPANFYTLILLFGLTFVACMGIATWVTVKMLGIWARISEHDFGYEDSPNETVFEPVPAATISFVSEKAEWEAGSGEAESADIYVPTLDGGIRNLDEESEAANWEDSTSDVVALTTQNDIATTNVEVPQPPSEEPLPVVEPLPNVGIDDNIVSTPVADALPPEIETLTSDEVDDTQAEADPQGSGLGDIEPVTELAPRAHRKAPPKLGARKKKSEAAKSDTSSLTIEDTTSLGSQEPETSEAVTLGTSTAAEEEIALEPPVSGDGPEVKNDPTLAAPDGADPEASVLPENEPVPHSEPEKSTPGVAETERKSSSLLHRKKPPKLPKKR